MTITSPYIARRVRRHYVEAAAPPDALAMLRDDHRRVSAMFRAFGRDKDELSAADKALRVVNLCRELTVHATLESELFYPAARDALGRFAECLLDTADVEHAVADRLIGELQAMSPDESHYDAKVIVLGHYIRHHVGIEHDDIFPRCRRSGMDLVALGTRMAERRAALLRRN